MDFEAYYNSMAMVDITIKHLMSIFDIASAARVLLQLKPLKREADGRLDRVDL